MNANQMLPSEALNNGENRFGIEVHRLSNLDGCAALHAGLVDFSNNGFGQNGVNIVLSSPYLLRVLTKKVLVTLFKGPIPRASLSFAVLHVVSMSTVKEVFWVYARRVVARVTGFELSKMSVL